VNPLERLPPADRRVVLALVELELGLDRRADISAARAAALLADDTRRPGSVWWSEACDVIAMAWGTGHNEVDRQLFALAHEHVGAGEQACVPRAVLAHLDDWASLDAAARAHAIFGEYLEHVRREMAIVAAAADAHGYPVAAPDLTPPLEDSRASIDGLLEHYVELGLLVVTEERRESWPVYDLARQAVGPPEDASAGG
jgi:hypothetical protein